MAAIARLIAAPIGGHVYLETGERIDRDIIRWSSYDGLEIYYIGDWADMVKTFMGPDDWAWGNPGVTRGISMAGYNRRRLMIHAGSAWDFSSKPEVAVRELLDTDEWCLDHFGKTFRSATGAMLACLKRYAPSHYNSDDLTLSYMGNGGTWAGPVMHLRASLGNAVEMDRREAYLQALRADPPTGYAIVRGMNLESAPGSALVCATAHQLDSEIPPLPARQGGSVFNPLGIIHGVWTVDMLRYAMQSGGIAENVTVHGGALPLAPGSFSEFELAINQLPKAQRKAVYTRVWSRASSSTTWKGRLVRKGESENYAGDDFPVVGVWGLRWLPDAEHMMDFSRPSLSAFITSHNYLATMQAARAMKPGSVALMHIDALWTSDIKGANRLDVSEWQRKGEPGPMRAYGHGTYDFGKKKARMIPLGDAEKATQYYRAWNKDPINDDATSSAMELFFPQNLASAIPRAFKGRKFEVRAECVRGIKYGARIRTVVEAGNESDAAAMALPSLTGISLISGVAKVSIGAVCTIGDSDNTWRYHCVPAKEGVSVAGGRL